MSFFTRLPIVVNDPLLPVLPFDSVESLTGYETDAYDHWIFGGSADSLAGVNQGKLLMPQAAAPTYQANYATLNMVPGNSLVTDIADASTAPRDTMCAVIRNQGVLSGSNRMIMGNKRNVDGSLGFMLYAPTASLAVSRQIHTAGAVSSAVETVPADSWVFLALARNIGGGNSVMYRGGQPAETFVQTTYARNPNMNLTLGNPGYTSGGSNGTMDAAEFIYFNAALSPAELDIVYARSKARLAKRGIVVI